MGGFNPQPQKGSWEKVEVGRGKLEIRVLKDLN
jgi:hypothetical protein